MIEIIRSFIDILPASQRDGAFFVLWMFIGVVLFAAWYAIRAYRSANNARIAQLEAGLAECKEKHEEQSHAYARLQRKLALVTGLLIAQLGNRSLPDGFLQIILNDDTEEVPDLGTPDAATR